jgi:hypothetical protein
MKRQTVRRLLGLGATAALVAAGLSQCGWVKAIQLDREVDRLCAIDGGVHIYETVTLPKEYFGPDGELAPPYRGRMGTDTGYGPEFQSILRTTYLVSGNPSMTRTVWRLVRKADERTLGEAITYSRAGGDLPGPSAPSGYTCPPPSADKNIERRIFTKQEN